MLLQKSLHLVLYNIVGIGFCSNQVYATSCHEYPSEYAYLDRSVIGGNESASANCRPYTRNLDPNESSHNYIHCNGTHLQLTDSNFGHEQHQFTDYYWLSHTLAGKLLFIFPTRVSLTTITLHYYSDSFRGLPRLRFYAVPDDFYIWYALERLSEPTYVNVTAVPPGREPAGRRSISINVNFNTKRVLMYKFNNSSRFAVSEVEFFIDCNATTTSVSTKSGMTTTTTIMDNASTELRGDITNNNSSMNQDMTTTTIMDNASTKLRGDITNNNSSINQELYQVTKERSSQTARDSQSVVLRAVGVVGTLFLVLTIFSIITLSLLLWHHKRRTHKSEIDSNSGSMTDNPSYSTSERGIMQQSQPQTSAQLYDQIHLSPSTGQTELISKIENETVSTQISNIYSRVDAENPQPVLNSETEMGKLPEDATYAAVDKKKKKKKTREAYDNSKNDHTDAEKSAMEKENEQLEAQDQPSLEEMYAVVHKKPKKSEEEEEIAPAIPAHTVESLYTAVQKKPQ